MCGLTTSFNTVTQWVLILRPPTIYFGYHHNFRALLYIHLMLMNHQSGKINHAHNCSASKSGQVDSLYSLIDHERRVTPRRYNLGPLFTS
jgi:hypothetical protein